MRILVVEDEQKMAGLLQRGLAGEGHFWGFQSLVLDATSLAIGKVAVTRAAGVFPDGTPFAFPDPHDTPGAVEISETLKGKRMLLCLPVYRTGSEEVSFDDDARSMARYDHGDHRFSALLVRKDGRQITSGAWPTESQVAA